MRVPRLSWLSCNNCTSPKMHYISHHLIFLVGMWGKHERKITCLRSCYQVTYSSYRIDKRTMISLSFSIRQPHKMNIFGLLSISFNFYVTNHHHAIISMSNHSHTINVAISLPLVCLHFTHIYTKKSWSLSSFKILNRK